MTLRPLDQIKKICLNVKMFKKNFYYLNICIYFCSVHLDVSHGASTDSGSSDNYLNQYKDAKKFILRAKKLEEKNKI